MDRDDEKFIKELRKKIICETQKKIREEWYKKNPNLSFYKDWSKHQKGQIKIILDTMKRVNKNLKTINIKILRDLEDYYTKSISITLLNTLDTFLEKYTDIEINEADKSKIQNLIESRSIPRRIYYDYIFSTIVKVKKFHKLGLTDDTYENSR